MKYLETVSLYFIIIFLSFVCSEKSCERNDDCSEQSHKRLCSVCVGQQGSLKCLYPFSDIYASSEIHRQCNLIKKCKFNPCENNGTCTISIGVGYVCLCIKSYYGQNCEFKYHRNLLPFTVNGGYKFQIIGELRGSTKYKNQITFSSSYAAQGEVLQFVVHTNEGYFDVAKQEKHQGNTKYEASVIYPFKEYQDGENFLYIRDTVIGYLTTLHISGFNRMAEFFRNSFKIFVSYENVRLNCMPAIRLKNCGSDFDSAAPFVKKSEIILRVETHVLPRGNLREKNYPLPICDPKKVKIELTWDVFLVETNNDSFDKRLSVMSKITHDDHLIRFKPFDLEFGLYWVSLEATIVQAKQKSQSTAYGFFKISSLPLRPVIEKGFKRTIRSREERWVMSAKNSEDPNGPPDKKIADSLMTMWSCTSNLPRYLTKNICKPIILRSTEPYVIPAILTPEKGTFKFTLEIWSTLYEKCVSKYCYEAKKHRFAHQFVVVDIQKNSVAYLRLDCIQNCLQTVTYRKFIAKAKLMNIENQHNIVYNWTYGVTGNNSSINTYNSPPRTPSYILDLPDNSLQPGLNYTVSVSTEFGDNKFSNSYSFETYSINYSGDCKVVPDEGIKGESYFDIYCDRVEGTAFKYEFSDLTPDQAVEGCQLIGRILDVSYNGELRHVKLTRGIVSICITYYGYYASKNVTVKLVELTNSQNYIKNYINNLQFYIRFGVNLRTLQYISLISDIYSKSSGGMDLFYTLLQGINQIPIQGFSVFKVHMATLHNVLSKMQKLELFFTDISMMILSKQNIYKMSKYFNDHKENFLHREILEISRATLNNLQLVSKLEVELPSKFSFDSLDTKSLYELSKSFSNVENTLENIKKTVNYIQIPGMNPLAIKSVNNSISAIFFKDDPVYNYTLQNMLNSYPDSPIFVTADLQNALEKSIPWEGSLTSCMIEMEDNIINNFDKVSSSNLLFLSLGKFGTDPETYQSIAADIQMVRIPIETKMIINSPEAKQIEEGEVTQLDPIVGEEKLDLLIKMFRFDPEPSSLIAITFLYPASNSSFRVLIMKDYRPSYEMILSKHKKINEKNYTYSFSCSGSDEEGRSFYYMAILPGPEVSVNKSVWFSFVINNTVCKSWSRVKWSSAGCDVSDKTSGNKVHCLCTHLSIFKAISPYLPNTIDPFTDAKLFLTVFDNPLVVCIMLTFLILYLILSIWAYRMGKIDRFYGSIVVLEDNFPGDKYAYLLAVCTSSRFLAGSSANVGIRLEGEGGSSRAHILKSPFHKVLTRDSDCWFLLFSPKQLGLLQQIHIWHDNSGFLPSWYCSEIHVYDLEERIETIFIVDQWLELSCKYYPEAVILPATPSDILSPSRLFFTNFISGLKSKQTFTGVFTKHPRGAVTRIQLLNVSMSSFMISLLCSIMFYRVPNEMPDDFSYNIRKKEVFVSIITLIVSATIGAIVSFEFDKSVEVTYHKSSRSLFLRGSQHEDYFYNQLRHSRAVQAKQGIKNDIITKTVKKVLNPIPLAPATLANGDPVVKIKTFWLILAWLTCMIIILICTYLIMLYGLKMGLVTSKQWVTSAFFSFASDTFCVSPLTMISVAVVLTSKFNFLVTLTNYQLSHKDILNSLPQSNDERQINDAYKNRYHPMYSPITEDNRFKILTKRERYHNWIDILNFLVFLVFFIVVYQVVHRLHSSQYQINSHLAKFIILHRFGNIGFFEAHNTNQVNMYIETTFLQALYCTGWYNGRPLSINHSPEPKYWTSDFTWKMFGLPSIRQLRVKPGNCRNVFLKNTSLCIPSWNLSSKDEDDYNVGWFPYTWKEANTDDSPWRYTFPSSYWLSTTYRLIGPSGTIYDNGGYIAPLKPTAKDSMGLISDLIQNAWQDQFTRVVFMELTLSHSNSRMLSKITLITEFLVSGATLKLVDVHSNVDCKSFNLWKFIFTVIILIIFFQICYKINRDGLLCTFKSKRNLVLIIIIVFGSTTVAMTFVNYLMCEWYDFDKRYQFSFTESFDYDSFLFQHQVLVGFYSLIFFASMCCVVGLYKGGKEINTYYSIMALSWKAILCLHLVLLLYFLCFYSVFLKINMMVFDSFLKTILYQTAMIPPKIGLLRNLILAFIYGKIILITVIKQFFFIVFVHFKGTTQGNEIHLQYFSFENFLYNEMKMLLKSEK